MKEVRECPCIHVRRDSLLLVKCRQWGVTVMCRVRASERAHSRNFSGLRGTKFRILVLAAQSK